MSLFAKKDLMSDRGIELSLITIKEMSSAVSVQLGLMLAAPRHLERLTTITW